MTCKVAHQTAPTRHFVFPFFNMMSCLRKKSSARYILHGRKSHVTTVLTPPSDNPYYINLSITNATSQRLYLRYSDSQHISDDYMKPCFSALRRCYSYPRVVALIGRANFLHRHRRCISVCMLITPAPTVLNIASALVCLHGDYVISVQYDVRVVNFNLPFSQLQGVEWGWPGRRKPDEEYSPASWERGGVASSSRLFLLV